VAPTVSLGNLSTQALSASTVSTMVSNITGYSFLQGIVTALDAVLTPKTALVWCLRVALLLLFCLIVSQDGVVAFNHVVNHSYLTL
jgi:hypothetical protein